MRYFSLGKLLLPLFLALVFDPSLGACTNLIVTKGASKDGSVICTYNCDTSAARWVSIPQNKMGSLKWQKG